MADRLSTVTRMNGVVVGLEWSLMSLVLACFPVKFGQRFLYLVSCACGVLILVFPLLFVLEENLSAHLL